jgi:hypothetical protein
MRLGDIVEGEDAPAKLEEQVRAEGDEAPERDLDEFSCWPGWSKVDVVTTGTISFWMVSEKETTSKKTAR